MDLAPRTDLEIWHDVRSALRWEMSVRDRDMEVSVLDGVVTLSGTVSQWSRRVAAQEAAYRVRGVREVANDLDVQRPCAATTTHSLHSPG